MKKAIFHVLTVFMLFYAQASFAAPNVSVVFVLDESGSISSQNFQLETDGFRGALSSLPADGSIEVSVVGFASSPSILVERAELTASNFSSIDQALGNNPQSGGTTAMGTAISTAATVLQGSSAPSKVICLSTDGMPTNESAATLAATNAKNAGVVLTPIGIGLTSSGKTFLDSIASNPPVPNPSDFTEFGTVVRNVCVGATQSAAGMALTPDPVNFGSYTPESLNSVNERREITLENNSTQTLTITNITLTGQDAGNFIIDKVNGDAFGPATTPFDLSPLNSAKIEVVLVPNVTPSDSRFDAGLSVTGTDSVGASVAASTALSARVDIVSLKVDVIDGGARGNLIAEVTPSSNLKRDGSSRLNETDVSQFAKVDTYRRVGFVADGNARLLVRVQTNVQRDIEFSLPANTGATLETLAREPASGTTLAIPETNVIDIGGGLFQATAVLIAPEQFLGQANEPEISFDIDVRIKNDDGTDANSKQETIRVKRAPVVLIHGLWADVDSRRWTHDPWATKNDTSDDEGMKPELKRSFFRVATYEYNNWEGPSVTMQPSNLLLYGAIRRQCLAENDDGFACTRNDIVGHSMGGLVARKYIMDNNHYKTIRNYQQGSVRRLVTLGTPHLGSGFANLLTWQDDPIGGCIIPVIGHAVVAELVGFLQLRDKKHGSALYDLSIDSDLLAYLNSQRQNVRTFGVIGDTGTNLPTWLDKAITATTGCDHAELFNGNNSDSVVSVVSAQGNLSTVNTTTLNGVQHKGMGTSAEVVQETISRLNGSIDDFSQVATIEMEGRKSVLIADLDRILRISEVAKSMFKQTFVAALGVLGISTVQAADLPTATLTVDTATPSPGTSIIFSADIAGQDISTVMLTDSGQYDESDDTAPYAWTLNLSNQASGQRTYKVVAIVDGQVIESNSVTVTVKPDLSALQQLTFEPGSPVTLFPGSYDYSRVMGLFNDGLKRVLTQSAMETVYSENIVDGVKTTAGDSPVISVSADGKVVGQQPGTALVVATNNGVTTARRINVVAMEEGDADGDGLPDNDEQVVGTNPFNPDSDGDGMRDDVEVGSNLSSPLDADGDGTIDALDNTTMVVMDEAGQRVSIHASAGALLSPSGRPLSDFPDRGSDLAEVDMERGLLGFIIEELSAGQSVDVTLTFESLPAGTNRYLKYGMKLPDGGAPEWYDFSDFDVSANRIVLHLTDNQLGDSNPVPGVISDPGGPGSDGSDNDDNSNSSGGGCSLVAGGHSEFDPTLVLLALLSVYCIRRKWWVGRISNAE